jgi:hypothetical protein
MTTNRTPLSRQPTAPPSRKAIDLYLAMKGLKCSCPDAPLGRTACSIKDWCDCCRRWWDSHGPLHEEIGAKLWEWPCIVAPTKVRWSDGVMRSRQAKDFQLKYAARLEAAIADNTGE